MRDDDQVQSPSLDMLGQIPEIGSFQRRRVRRTANAIGTMAVICIALIVVALLTVGVETTFGPDTPVRLPILGLIAAVILTPIVWSAVFRSRRYGLILAKDTLIVDSWWRRRTFERADLSAAEPLPGVTRIRDGFFSGRGSNAEPFAMWLWPNSVDREEFPLGVTTGTWEATGNASRRINAWLGVDVDFDEGRADSLLHDD